MEELVEALVVEVLVGVLVMVPEVVGMVVVSTTCCSVVSLARSSSSIVFLVVAAGRSSSFDVVELVR